MKILLKFDILILLFFLSVTSVVSQDYYKLSEQFFNDTKTVHVNYVKKAIQENNAEQLVIDLYNLTSEHEDDIERVNNKIKSIEDNFKSNYTNPDYVYDCKKTYENRDEAKHLKKRLTYIETSMNIAKNSFNLCKNNVYRTGNCSQQQNNYKKQVDLYNSVLSELKSAVDNYEYYKDDCNDAINEYQNAYNNVKRQIDNLITNQKQRINERERKDRNYRNQINEIFLNTPMFNVEYYDNGNKSKEGYLDLRTNKYVGAFKKYYSNGNLEMECTLKNGQPDGHYTEYYETGVKKAEVDYKNGAVVGSWKNYNEEGVDEQAETQNEILDHWRQEQEERDKYYEAIDNTSVTESIVTNPIRTIKEGNIELVIDFSKASKETINFFLVRPDLEKSKELRKKYINDLYETDGGKVSCKYIGDDGQIKYMADYKGLTVTVNNYNDDGSYTQTDFQYRNKIGIVKKYDKNGNRIAGEEREADINTFLKQKNFYTPATLSYGKNIEISDGIWEVVHGGSDQDTYQYSYKQLNDTQIELTFIQSNDSSNKYKKGDKFIVEFLFMNIKSKFYKLTITPLDTSYGGLLEGYYYK